MMELLIKFGEEYKEEKRDLIKITEKKLLINDRKKCKWTYYQLKKFLD